MMEYQGSENTIRRILHHQRQSRTLRRQKNILTVVKGQRTPYALLEDRIAHRRIFAAKTNRKKNFYRQFSLICKDNWLDKKGLKSRRTVILVFSLLEEREHFIEYNIDCF